MDCCIRPCVGFGLLDLFPLQRSESFQFLLLLSLQQGEQGNARRMGVSVVAANARGCDGLQQHMVIIAYNHEH